MKTIVIDDKFKASIPQGYEDLSFDQFHELDQWKISGGENIIELVSILTGVPNEILNRTNYGDFKNIILPQLGWTYKRPKLRLWKLPRKIEIMDKEIQIPLNAEYETLGQKVAVDSMFVKYLMEYADDANACAFHQMTYAIAAYISPKIREDGEFDMEYTTYIQRVLMEKPAKEIVPLGRFFLRKWIDYQTWNPDYQSQNSLMRKWGQMRGNLIRLVSFVRGMLLRMGI